METKFYLIMKVAAGGDYWPEGCENLNNGINVPKPWNKSDAVQMRHVHQILHSWHSFYKSQHTSFYGSTGLSGKKEMTG